MHTLHLPYNTIAYNPYNNTMIERATETESYKTNHAPTEVKDVTASYDAIRSNLHLMLMSVLVLVRRYEVIISLHTVLPEGSGLSLQNISTKYQDDGCLRLMYLHYIIY